MVMDVLNGGYKGSVMNDSESSGVAFVMGMVVLTAVDETITG